MIPGVMIKGAVMLWNRLLPLVATVVALFVVAPVQAQSPVNGAVTEAAAVATAEAQLVRELELSSPDVERVEPVTWPNGCLVLAEPCELYTQALVDGFVIWFVAEGTALRARTDGDGRSVRIAAERISAAAAAALPAGASLRSAGARGEGTSSDGASGEVSDSDAPDALPTTGDGLVTAETDDDAPAWVWGVIGVVAAGTVAVGTTYGVWLRRREEISRGRGSSK